MGHRGDTIGTASPRRPPIYRDLILLQLGLIVLVIDQITKYVVQSYLVLGESFPREGFLRITHTYNTGSAFGLFQDQNFPLIFASFVGVTILVFIYRSQHRPGFLLRLSLGLQLGGAVGNLLDRVRLGHVTDFLDVGAWPVFNLADASIVTGLVFLAWLFLKTERGQRKAKESMAGDGTVPIDGTAFHYSYTLCPICDADMLPWRQGWRCSACGVREWIEDRS